jgi:PBP1b-binding outer membrane lipoprotein LpoB
MFFKTTVTALAMLISGCVHAQSSIDTVESIENPGSLRQR